MNVILSFLEGIANFFEVIFDVIRFIFVGAVDLVLYSTTVFANLDTYISWLPSAVVSILMFCFSAVVIYKIFGRS